MNLLDDILQRAEVLSRQELPCSETDRLPAEGHPGNLILAATVMVVSVKDMTGIIRKRGKRAAHTTRTLFELALQSFADATGGQCHELSADEFLLVYADDPESAGETVRAAMRLAHILKAMTKKVAAMSGVTFSVGLDHGRVLAARSGGKTFWYGTCIQKAEAIAQMCQRPSHVGISGRLYCQLDDETKTRTTRMLGIPLRRDAWQAVPYLFDGEEKHYYSTHLTIEPE